MNPALNIPASLFAAAIALWFIQAISSLLIGNKCKHNISSGFFLLPCLLLMGSTATAWSHSIEFQAPSFIAFGDELLKQRIDSLACIFLLLLSVVGASSAIFSPKYLEHFKDRLHPGHYWAALALFMLSMSLVIVSSNAISFLIFWEVMSLSSLALVASEHTQHKVRHASIFYMTCTRLATTFVMSGFICMHALSHSWDFSSWIFNDAWLPSMLISIGLCIKAGIWPFHLWLPYAYTAAPSPVSALMSGVMSKIALYTAIRLFFMGHCDSLIVAGVFLGLGLISSFWGLLFALVQQDIKRVLAYSSIENLGIILCGLGLALIARHMNIPDAAALALTAALFHCFNHGIFKSLLFLGAGAIDWATDTRDLSNLGGLASKMPWTMACFVIGSAAISALPPFNGFASKWLLYSGLFHQCFESPHLPVRAVCLLGIGILSLVGGLAVCCFCRLVGVTFLGNARSHNVAKAKELNSASVAAQVILAALCVILGLSAPFVASQIQQVACSLLGNTTLQAAPFTIPIAQLALAGLVLFALIYSVFLKSSATRKYITWECGFGDLSPRTQVTAASFTQPIARIFGPLLRFKLLVEITGSDRRHFPEHIKVEPQVVSFLETRVYMPTVALVQKIASMLAKIQAGSIHLYLLYLCITLIVLTAVGTRL